MADIASDKALTSLSERTTPASTDLMYVVVPTEPNASRSYKATIANIATAMSVLSYELAADLDDDQDYNGFVITGVTAGETLSAWNLVYLDGVEEQWMKADANAAGKFPCQGMVVADTAEDAEATVLIMGVVRNDAWTWTTFGESLYLGETPGEITETAPSDSGDCVQNVGYVIALTSDTIIFNPAKCWIELA